MILLLALVLLSAPAAGEVFTLGSSYTFDGAPYDLDGTPVWHIYCGMPLEFIYDRPTSHCISSSTPWPEALSSQQFDYVSFQPVNNGIVTQQSDIEAITSWLAMQPDAVAVIHTTWPVPGSWESVFHGSPDHTLVNRSRAYFYTLIESLSVLNPGRTILSDRNNEMLDRIYHDIEAGVAPIASFGLLFRDASGHMSRDLGTYLQHNALRRAFDQPTGVLPVGVVLDPVVKEYLDAIVNLAICGDALQEGAEECDDGNLANGDGCSESCLQEICGNGREDFGEGCDDGNGVAGDGCDPNCTASGCGNGFASAEEQCDDGNALSGDGCDANCTLTACGNGVLTGAEACDDGNLASGDGCDANCTATACGNWIAAAGEACDDGNLASGDGCDANCTISGCGNGIAAGGEACDDANPIEADGCNSACELDFGVQSAAQARCIEVVARGVGRIAKAQGRVNARCLAAWIAGRQESLGPAPSTLDSCLGADPNGRVARARHELEAREREECAAAEPPSLALGDDRLAGSPAASEQVIALLGDLLGHDTSAAGAIGNRVPRCQKRVLRRSARLFQALWATAEGAKLQKLVGGHTDPARNNEQLRDFIMDAMSNSEAVERASSRLRRATQRACAGVSRPMAAFPGCDGSQRDVAACAERAARCRSCRLLDEADPSLTPECDAFDDRVLNGSCSS